MKILILVMSHETNDENFITYKKTWDKIIEEINLLNLPIDVFFLYTDPNISNDYIVNGNKLISKCEENYWHSLLIKVLNGFDFSYKNGYDLTFKLNLSTLINLDKFYNFCLNSKDRKFVYDGMVGNYRDFKFCSGAGMLLTRDSVKLVLDSKTMITEEWTDDIFIGYILNKFNKITPNSEGLSRYDIISLQDNLNESVILNSTHIRIKIRTSNHDSIMTKKVYEILYKKKYI